MSNVEQAVELAALRARLRVQEMRLAFAEEALERIDHIASEIRVREVVNKALIEMEKVLNE